MFGFGVAPSCPLFFYAGLWYTLSIMVEELPPEGVIPDVLC